MSEQEIIEGNKLIAEFMGYTPEYLVGDELRHSGYGMLSAGSEFMVIREIGFLYILGRTQNLSYHKHWEQLMPVIEKIESIYLEKHGFFGVRINSNSCIIQGTKFKSDNPNYVYLVNTIAATKIEATWISITHFINWYNIQEKI